MKNRKLYRIALALVCTIVFILHDSTQAIFAGAASTIWPSITTVPIPTISVITGPSVYDGTVTLDAGSGYDTYSWKNGEVVVGSSRTLITKKSGVYTVTVSVSGVSGTATSPEYLYSNHNRIISNTILKAGVTNATDVATLPIGEIGQTIQYFDGLGRPIQGVETKASPSNRDFVQPTVYDAYGREHRKYLPVTVATTGTGGLYKPELMDTNGNYTGAANNFYNNPVDDIADDPKPYAETLLEASPLNRPLKQGAPGEVWHPNASVDHSVKSFYEFNKINDVILFTYNTQSGEVDFGTYYAINELYANRILDEHQHDVIEYQDKEGKMILKRVQYGMNGSTKLYAETYYIYDDFGNLVIVLPPEAVKKIKTDNGF